jgi:hypothetical protein
VLDNSPVTCIESGFIYVNAGGQIDINDGSAVTVNTIFYNQGAVNVNSGGDLTIESGGLFYLNYNGWAPLASLSIDGGTVVNNGSISWRSASVTALGDVDNNGAILFLFSCQTQTSLPLHWMLAAHSKSPAE